ncbi:MAG TPA: VanZ family protein [Gaiellaceae bacterium]|nr:VanZ family protein [Gaiellaceae bacterium]
MPVPVKRPRRQSRPGLLVGIASDASGALSVWLPVLVWAALIFVLSSIPSLSTGLGTWDTILRKGAHVTEYAILGALLLRALGREPLALAAGIAYAATDELHQHFVRGRHASPLDVLIDAAGVAVGILVLRRLSRPGPGDRPLDMARSDVDLQTGERGEADPTQSDTSWGQSPGQGR